MDRIEEAKEDEKEKDASKILSILASMAGYDSFAIEKTSMGVFFLKFIKKNDKACCYCYVSMFNIMDQMSFPWPAVFSMQDDKSVVENLFRWSEEGCMLVASEYGPYTKTVKLIDAYESLEEFLIKNDLKIEPQLF